ncbi:MAG: hypothetical protein GY925_08005 [Actinomycetia bacterium]|nr:hypothetical protein [Actinomycetes bacterium]
MSSATPAVPDQVATSVPATTTTSSGEPPSAAGLCDAAPPGTTEIAISSPWEVGMVRELELQIGKRNSTRPSLEGLSSTPVTLTVIGEDAGGWVLRWEAGTTSLEALGLPQSLAAEAAEGLEDLPRLVIDYRVDEFGFYAGVVDPAALRTYVNDVFDWMAVTLPDPGFDTGEVQDFFAGLPDEGFEQMFTQDLQVFHGFGEIAIFVDEVLEFDDLLPNAFGGAAFPAVTTLAVIDLVDDSGCAAIQIRTTPDPDQFVRILGETLRETLPDVYGDMSDEEMLAEAGDLEIENVVVVQVDAGSGSVRRVTATQAFESATEGRTDTKIVTDITDG